MAVKFSDFTTGSVLSDIDFLVGYKSSSNDNVQIPVALVDSNTTYSISTAQSGLNENITLTSASPSGTESILITAAGGITLTDDGANTGFTISSADTDTTYTLEPGTKVSNYVPIDLTPSSGSASAVKLVEGSNIALSKSASDEITITGAAGGAGWTADADTGSDSVADGGTLDLAGGTGIETTATTGQVEFSLSTVLTGGTYTNTDLTVDNYGRITAASSGSSGGVTSVDEISPGTSTGDPIVVNPTTGVVEIQSMAYAGGSNVGHVPAGGGAGEYLDGATGTWTTLPSASVSISKQQFTGDNTTVDFVLTAASGLAAANLAIYISGVYQNAEDASGVAQFTVGAGTNPTLTFATAPPTTANNGIEVVITR